LIEDRKRETVKTVPPKPVVTSGKHDYGKVFYSTSITLLSAPHRLR
jgi:hypothetical protein